MTYNKNFYGTFSLYLPAGRVVPYADRFGIGSPIVPIIDIGRALRKHKIPNLKKARDFLRSPPIGFDSSSFASPTWRRKVYKAVVSEGFSKLWEMAWLYIIKYSEGPKSKAAKYILEGAFAFACGEGVRVPLILPLNPKTLPGARWDASLFYGLLHYSPSPEFYLNLEFVPLMEDILKAKGSLTAKQLLRKTTAEGAKHTIIVKNCRLYLSGNHANNVAWDPQWYDGTKLTLYKDGTGYVLKDAIPTYSWVSPSISKKKSNPRRRKGKNPSQTILIKNKHRPTHNSLGQLIHSTESGIRAFWKWFGDSKAVDEKGHPLVLYHGTPDGRFIKSTGIFMSLKDRMGARKGVGVFWFAKDYRTACTYAIPERAFDYQGCEPLTLPTYIRLRHPLILNANGAKWRHAQHHGKTTYIIDQAKEQGSDGVIIRNVKDDYNSNAQTITTDTFAVFSSTQIKSAKDNRGTFAPKDPSMINPIPRGTYKFIRMFHYRKKEYIDYRQHPTKKGYVTRQRFHIDSHVGPVSRKSTIKNATATAEIRKLESQGWRDSRKNPGNVIRPGADYFVKASHMRRIQEEVYERTGRWMSPAQINEFLRATSVKKLRGAIRVVK